MYIVHQRAQLLGRLLLVFHFARGATLRRTLCTELNTRKLDGTDDILLDAIPLVVLSFYPRNARIAWHSACPLPAVRLGSTAAVRQF